MKIKIDLSFQKDTDKIKNKKLLYNIAQVIESVSNTNDFKRIKNLKKLSGFKDYYRIRLGDYRIGIAFRNNEFIFIRCLHRKDVYKYFP